MLKPKTVNDSLVLRFSISQGLSLKHVENVSWKWGDFVARLERPYRDPLTLAKFKELGKDVQAKRKNNGYFVGAQMKGGVRDKRAMSERQIITFDIDQGSEELLRSLRNGTSGLGGIECVIYSTRTHGNGAIKLRIVIPLAKRLPHEHFQALSRILAWEIDFNMVAVDTVSFVPTQIMYWPAHCADIEPVFIHRQGPLLDVYRTLDEWAGGDGWKDISILPKSPNEVGIRESGTKKADPLLKRGIVGAFNRTHDIHDAIEKYLSDIYIPSEVGPDGVPSRYSYVPGTSSNGLQVFDNGMAIQSWHGSDPISGMNVGPYDLVRINLFGDLDPVGGDPKEDPRKAKSYQAMERMLMDDVAVATELRESNYSISPDDVDDTFEGDEIEAAEVTSQVGNDNSTGETEDLTEPNWMDQLDTNEKQIIKPTLFNLILILKNAPTFKGRFGYNEFTYRDCLVKTMRSKSLRVDCRVPKAEGFVMIEDHHCAAIRQVLEAPRGKGKTGWGLRVPDRDLREAIIRVCRQAPFHPVRDYLDSLAWDGKSRLERLWVMTCHTPNTPYFRQTSRNLLLAAVARIYEPGCKFDFMPVLIGPQGLRKSTLVMMLGFVRWAGETPGHYDDKKKFVEASLGFWWLENGEMTHFKRAADEDAIKAMLSGTADTVRLSYGHHPVTIKRQFLPFGTTNATEFLRDRHRRIWAIPCGPGQIDIDWLVANRDQMYAEAVATYRKLERDPMTGFLPLHLTGKAEAEWGGRQQEHRLPDEAETMAGMIRPYLEMVVPLGQSKPGWTTEDAVDDAFAEEVETQRTVTCGIEIFVRALGGDRAKFDRRAQLAVSEAMQLLAPEWQKGESAQCGQWGKQRTYFRAAVLL